MTLDTYKGYFTSDTQGYDFGFAHSGRASFDGSGNSTIIAVNFNNNFAGIQYYYVRNGSSYTNWQKVKLDSVDGFEDIVTEV